MRNPFAELTRTEWILWVSSVVIVAASNILSGQVQLITLSATLIGVTALIFIARGDVFGQILTVIFSLLYAANAWTFRYYGEILTYLGMSAPIAALSVVSWLKNPYEKGKNEVKVQQLTARHWFWLTLLTVLATAASGVLLKALFTPNLFVSTISVTTSFLAASLMFLRSPLYALAYALNDVVLILLWVLATLESLSYLPMILCFVMFFINDMYGYISWKRREKRQA